MYAMNLLNKIKDTFTSSTAGESVVGVDITDSFIKVVELSRSDQRAKLETYGKIALGPYGEAEVGQVIGLSKDTTIEALKDVLRESKVSTKECGIAIPMSSSLTSFIEVPAMERGKLENVVPIEARKHIPVPLSEVYLDWHIIPREEVEYGRDEEYSEDSLKVMVVAIHKESINSFQTIIEKADLNPNFFEIEVFSTIRSVLNKDLSSVLLVDLGAAVTKVYVVRHGLVFDSHVINRGGQDISDSIAKSLDVSFGKAEELKRQFGLDNGDDSEAAAAVHENASVIFEDILSDVQEILIDFETENNQSVNKVLLTGGTAIFSGLPMLARDYLDADVELGDPFEKVHSPAFLDETLQEAGPEFAVAIGVALRNLQGR